MNVVQFGGKFFHKDCFEDFLNKEKSSNKVASDYRPNTKAIEEADLDDEDNCESCGKIFLREDSGVDTTMQTRDDDDDDEPEKKDNVTNTPSTVTPPRRRVR